MFNQLSYSIIVNKSFFLVKNPQTGQKDRFNLMQLTFFQHIKNEFKLATCLRLSERIKTFQ
jgi:hypothetical protein